MFAETASFSADAEVKFPPSCDVSLLFKSAVAPVTASKFIFAPQVIYLSYYTGATSSVPPLLPDVG